MRTLYLLLVCSSVFTQHGNVGIGATLAQQKLHHTSSLSAIRIDELNYMNNSYNEGDINSDLDLSNDIFPLYVNDQGSFDLEFTPFISIEDTDALDDSTLSTNSITLPSSDSDGIESTQITSYSLIVSRTTILEIKYNSTRIMH